MPIPCFGDACQPLPPEPEDPQLRNAFYGSERNPKLHLHRRGKNAATSQASKRRHKHQRETKRREAGTDEAPAAPSPASRWRPFRLAPGDARPSFGLLPGRRRLRPSPFLRTTGDGAVPETLSGSHPFELRAELRFNHQGSSPPISDGDCATACRPAPGPDRKPQGSDPVPSGPVPHSAQLALWADPLRRELSRTSQVGVVTFITEREEGQPRTFGVFDVQPPTGGAAALGAAPFGDPVR